jgi:hypothetical protein
MGMKRALVLGVVIAAALSVTGCKLKMKKGDLETKLSAELEKKVGVKPTSVSCPEDVQKKKGNTTTCTAAMPDGNTRTVNVTMGGGDAFTWESPAVEPATPPPSQATFRTIPNSAVEILSPPDWKVKQDGDWGLLVSPDDKAVLAFVAFSRPNESTARIGQISRVLRASSINWGSPKRGLVGPDSMPANIAGGTCLFNGKESTIEYATVNPGGATQILVVYATNNDVPPNVKSQGIETFKSIRRKR